MRTVSIQRYSGTTGRTCGSYIDADILILVSFSPSWIPVCRQSGRTKSHGMGLWLPGQEIQPQRMARRLLPHGAMQSASLVHVQLSSHCNFRWRSMVCKLSSEIRQFSRQNRQAETGRLGRPCISYVSTDYYLVFCIISNVRESHLGHGSCPSADNISDAVISPATPPTATASW